MIFTTETPSTQSSEFFVIKTLNSALSAPFDKLSAVSRNPIYFNQNQKRGGIGETS